MAKLDGKFLRGVIGPVIMKKSGNKQLVVAKKKRGSIKQSVATKKASDTFGMASGLSGRIRTALKEESIIAGDSSVHPRLTSTLNQMLSKCRDPISREFSFKGDSFHGLVAFDFNATKRLTDKLPGQLLVDLTDGVLKVGFPDTGEARVLKFVKGSSACKMTFSLVLFRLAEGLVSRKVQRHSLMVEKEAFNLNGLSFVFDVPKGCLAVLSVTMEYYHRKHPLANSSLNVGGICYAELLPGEYEEGSKFLWAAHELYFEMAGG